MRKIDLSAVAKIRTTDGTWTEVTHIFGDVVELPPAGNVGMFTITRPDGSRAYVRADDIVEYEAKPDQDLFVDASRRSQLSVDDLAAAPAPSTFGTAHPWMGKRMEAPTR